MTDRILYPRREAAHQLGISVRTLDAFAKVNEIHPRYIGGKVLYHRAEIERFARANHSSPFGADEPKRSAPQSAPAAQPLPISA